MLHIRVVHLIAVEFQALRYIYIMCVERTVQVREDVLLETTDGGLLVAIAYNVIPQFIASGETFRETQKNRVAAIFAASIVTTITVTIDLALIAPTIAVSGCCTELLPIACVNCY